MRWRDIENASKKTFDAPKRSKVMGPDRASGMLDHDKVKVKLMLRFPTSLAVEWMSPIGAMMCLAWEKKSMADDRVVGQMVVKIVLRVLLAIVVRVLAWPMSSRSVMHSTENGRTKI